MDAKPYLLLTGASSGIGTACAIHLSAQYDLILAGRNPDKLECIQRQCQRSDAHRIWVCDLAKERGTIIQSLTTFLKEQNAVVDNFIHSAGLSKICHFRDVPQAYIDEIFNVNFFSAVEILQVLLKRVNSKKLKNVVMLSSASSVRADKGNSIYAASKGAINSLVVTLANELAPLVRVNAIAPGTTDTPMSADFLSGKRSDIEKILPLGIGKVEDIANFAEFLISDKARWITGQTFFVDGGLTTIGI